MADTNFPGANEDNVDIAQRTPVPSAAAVYAHERNDIASIQSIIAAQKEITDILNAGFDTSMADTDLPGANEGNVDIVQQTPVPSATTVYAHEQDDINNIQRLLAAKRKKLQVLRGAEDENRETPLLVIEDDHPSTSSNPTSTPTPSTRVSNINLIVAELSKEVDNFHPNRWYDHLFRWILDVFYPVRRMKDAVRGYFKDTLKAIEERTDSDEDKETRINKLIDRFSNVQKYIEVHRQESIEGKDLLFNALRHVLGIHGYNYFDITEDKKSHKGVEKEEQRKQILLGKIDTIKKTYKQS